MNSPCPIAAVLMASMLAGCMGHGTVPPAFHANLHHPYRLDAGDRIRVTVFGQDDLTNSYAVDESGKFTFPLIGAVPARGRTVEQLEADLAARLRQGYLRYPDISIEIDTYRPVFVTGQVGSAGQYAYQPGLTVQQAVAMAGGFSVRANRTNVDATREIDGEVLTARVPISDPVLPGDVIHVRQRLF